MNLSEYFETTKGTGVLATANGVGEVDAAVYGHPHFVDEETVAFIMTDRLSHENVKANPHAAYLFVEAGQGYNGKRLYLTKISEETDADKIKAIRRRPLTSESGTTGETKYLVSFRIDKVRPLVGD